MMKYYEITNRNNTQIIDVFNLFSESRNQEIIEAVEAAMTGNLVLNLDAAPFMNSMGLNFLIKLQNACKSRNGVMAIANPSAKIVELLEITRLKPLFLLAESVEEAVQLVRK